MKAMFPNSPYWIRDYSIRRNNDDSTDNVSLMGDSYRKIIQNKEAKILIKKLQTEINKHK